MHKGKSTSNFIVCLLFLGFSFFSSGNPKVYECDNIFSSSAYDEYERQLTEYLVQHPSYENVKNGTLVGFNGRLNLLLATLENHFQEEKPRERHQNLVIELRELIKKFESYENIDEDSRRLFQDLIRWFYLESDLRNEFFNFISNYIPEDRIGILENIKQTFKKIKSSSFTKRGQNSPNEDQFWQGNLPFKVATLNNAASTKLFRFGNPVQNSEKTFWSAKYSIHPEFRFFIKAQKSHFYVNLMRRTNKEKNFSVAIEKLEEEFPNFYIVTLDKDSHFYWQEGKKFSEKIAYKEFKAQFLKAMLTKNGNFYWSKHLRDETFKEELSAILDSVHGNYFSFQPILRREDRRDFIELSYLAILNKLVDKWQPDSMNITCRQGMDRGPSLMMLWLLQQHLPSSQDVMGILLGSPVMIHNRPSHESRIDRFISAARYF